MRKRIGLGLLLAILMLAGLGGKEETPSVMAQGGSATEIFRLVNELRFSYGLPHFEWNPALAAAAQNQANYMAANNIYSHMGAGGSTPQTRAQAAGYVGRATENIVGGTGLTPGQGVAWWRNSPTHFATMITDRYVQAGVGFAQGFDQNFYALVVGSPSDRPPTDTSAEDARNNEVFAPVAPIVLAQPREDGSIVHTVGSGQSLWAIAARYEVPLQDLLLFNNLQEDSLISPGDELTIRLADGAEPPPTPTPPATHIVREGETPWTIAAIFQLSLEEFYWLNNLSENDMLHPGNEVKIRLLPGEEPPPTPTPRVAHIVRSGDTLWDISVRYGLALADLLAYNGLEQNAVLSVGQALLVVPPTPLPTPTPEATATLPPTPTAVATETPSPTPTSDSLAAAMTAAPQITPEAPAGNWQDTASTGILVVAGSLVLLAGVGIVLLRRQII